MEARDIFIENILDGFEIVYHTAGYRYCNKPSVIVRSTLGLGDIPTVGDVFKLNGSRYELGDRVYCNSCGNPIVLDVDSSGKLYTHD